MENLTISDSGPRGGGGGVPPPVGGTPGPLQAPPAPQQLPPQMFTTAAQLLDLTDKKLMVALRDGRKLIGVLRSWDQFANLVLQSTIERVFVPPPLQEDGTVDPNARGLYADIPRGIFLVRGENVLLLGEIDLDKDDEAPAGYDATDAELVQKLANERKDAEKAKSKVRIGRLNKIGFEGEHMGDILL
ncbi:hypothetical protein jhhlp_004378 [Lomentospora prolificans]|uniref:U6 snRNA-associated Sm-like protein LSm1 n=1 Tax=Lomentospora prolificans TaxID=41688 RepID=A0A2N3NBI6_9PEZI|nr:hypothetical protein jhhlp_004378 [Lomentospora prolificans]